MLSYPEPIRFQRRVKPKLPARTPIPTGPLMLVSATVVANTGADAQLALVFDNGANDPLANVASSDFYWWTAQFDGWAWEASAPLEQTGYNAALLSLGNAGEAPGPAVVSYGAGSNVLRTASGRELGAIVDAPVVA